jgi:osmotically inducible protein OsmC
LTGPVQGFRKNKTLISRKTIRRKTRRTKEMARTASAVWQGTLKEGKGSISVGSGLFKDAQYSFSSRFEEGVGTNPEELIAAAHAGCFTMAFGAELGKGGYVPEKIETTASVTLRPVDGKPTITSIALVTRAKVPGIDQAAFDATAAGAKAGCPISRLFAGNTEITLDAKLV